MNTERNRVTEGVAQRRRIEKVIVGYIMPVLLALGLASYLLTGRSGVLLIIVVVNLGALLWHAKRRIEMD